MGEQVIEVEVRHQLAETAYEAYRTSGGVSFASNTPLPEWKDQAAGIQQAWDAAVHAVLAKVSGMDSDLDE